MDAGVDEVGGYRLIRELGRGGFGSVHLARTPDGGLAAVKLLHLAPGTDPRFAEMFAREVEAARRVSPFCVARVLDADPHAAQPWIATEYIEGRTLAEEIESEGPRGDGGLQRLAVSTATALSAIHDAGVVHRDFKPENIMMGPDGPRVIDFGIARALEETAGFTATSRVGTLNYMAPEQLEDAERLTPALDVFAWGAVMVYAATGRHAFAGHSRTAVMKKILMDEPDCSAVPPRLRGLVLRCLDKAPERRPTAQRILDTLLGSPERVTGEGTDDGTAAEPEDAAPTRVVTPEGTVLHTTLPGTAPFPDLTGTAPVPAPDAARADGPESRIRLAALREAAERTQDAMDSGLDISLEVLDAMAERCDDASHTCGEGSGCDEYRRLTDTVRSALSAYAAVSAPYAEWLSDPGAVGDRIGEEVAETPFVLAALDPRSWRENVGWHRARVPAPWRSCLPEPLPVTAPVAEQVGHGMLTPVFGPALQALAAREHELEGERRRLREYGKRERARSRARTLAVRLGAVAAAVVLATVPGAGLAALDWPRVGWGLVLTAAAFLFVFAAVHSAALRRSGVPRLAKDEDLYPALKGAGDKADQADAAVAGLEGELDRLLDLRRRAPLPGGHGG
jgi:hypothetical protein